MNDLITPTELATRRKCTENKLAMDRFRRKGTPYLKLGHKTIRYRMTDVLAEEEAHLVETTPIQSAS